MRGVIFRSYLSFLDVNFGYEKVDEILLSDEYPNSGGFSSAGKYDTKYLFTLIEKSAFLFNNSKEKLITEFGKYAFLYLLGRVKVMYKDKESPFHVDNAYDFLENLNQIHFEEVSKLYPNAEFPKFDIERIAEKHIVFDYCSQLDLPNLVYGLTQGCLDYFYDNSSMTMTLIEEKDESIDRPNRYRFEVKN